MIDKRGIGDIDLLALGNVDDRDDHGEFRDIAAEVRCHGDDGAFAIAGEHDLGSVVEQVRIGLGDIEAAKRAGGGSQGQAGKRQGEACNQVLKSHGIVSPLSPRGSSVQV